MSTQKILIQLPAAQHSALKAMADKVGLSVAAQARIAFQYYIEHHTPKDTMTKPSPNSLSELEQRMAELINDKRVFATDDDAHHWMSTFMQLRTHLAQRTSRPKEAFVLPTWAAEQVMRDPDTQMYSLAPQVKVVTPIPSEDEVTPEADAKEHSDWYSSLNK